MKLFFFLINVFVFGSFVSAQIISTQEIEAYEEMINKVRNSDIVAPLDLINLIAVGAGTFEALNIPNDPIEALREIGIIIPAQVLELQSTEEQRINIGSLSFLVAQLYDIPGGVMYSIFPSEHYATKELQHRRLVPDHYHPLNYISGEEIAQLIVQLDALEELGELR